MKRRAALEPTAPYESGIWGTAEHPCPSERTLAAHLDGELDDARAQLVDAHLDRCAACASDSRRIENLSHCLRAWARGRAAVEPPSRLLSRVLRTVSPEGAALRLETARSRTVALKVAAAVLVWTGGVVAGLRGAPLPDAVGPAPARSAVSAPRVASSRAAGGRRPRAAAGAARGDARAPRADPDARPRRARRRGRGDARGLPRAPVRGRPRGDTRGARPVGRRGRRRGDRPPRAVARGARGPRRRPAHGRPHGRRGR